MSILVSGNFLPALVLRSGVVANPPDDPPAAPVNSSPPIVTGTGEVGATLTASNGAWVGLGITFSRQWQRNGSNIAGATGPTYVVQGADANKVIRVVVTATNPGGSASANSAGRSIAGVTGSGVFFDTANGDMFTGSKFAVPSDSSITTTSGQVAFNSATSKALDAFIKRSDGSTLKWAFDDFVVDATFAWQSFPGADVVGTLVGTKNDELSDYAGGIQAHPGGATFMFSRIYNTGAPLAYDTGGQVPFSPGAVIRARYIKTGDVATFTVTYPAPTGDRTVSITQTLTASSLELPRKFSSPMVRFATGNFALTGLKVTAAYANARFAFVGDSITQGRFAASFADGFAQKIRADYPGQVLVAGAPGATTGDWLVPIKDVIAMRPTTLFVMLGTNDLVTGRSLAAIQADYTALLASLSSESVNFVILTTPPNGLANTPTLNTWLKGLGHPYIDTYAALLGTGVAMAGSFDSGDGIHPNSAGMAAVYTAIKNYISANGI